jgi:hypothetical protein
MIQQAITSPDSKGILAITYETILTVWAEVKLMNRTSAYYVAVRGVNAGEDLESHKIIIRKTAVHNLGTSFTRAFATAFDIMQDANPIKTNYSIFLQQGSANKGRRFSIKGTQADEESDEYIIIYATEMREEGTGWA